MSRRVVALGVSGAGKTTLAKRLGLPYLDMSALVDAPRKSIDDAIATETWAADASLQKRVGDRVLERADTIVWLDVPLRIALWRIVLRSRRDGQWPFGLIAGAVRAHFSNRRRFPERLEPFRSVVRLRSPREVESWLASP